MHSKKHVAKTSEEVRVNESLIPMAVNDFLKTFAFMLSSLRLTLDFFFITPNIRHNISLKYPN